MNPVRRSRFLPLGLLFVLVAGGLRAQAGQSPLEIAASSDRVIPEQRREAAIAFARDLVFFSEPSFLEQIETLDTPFRFRAPEPAEPAEQPEDAVEPDSGDGKPEMRPKPRRTLNDREILAMVAPTLRERIRGAIVKGDEAFLSTDNGGRVPLGFTFPARVRILPGETFQITVSAITTKSFTLKLNNTEITIPIGEQMSAGGVTPGS
ncbi:MAG: hypothetical protein ACFE0O_01330 [Opitutales bacterium]